MWRIIYINMCDVLLKTLSDQLTNSWSRVLLEKLTFLPLVKKYRTFYGTRMFITLFTVPRHVSVSWTKLIQPTPSCHISLTSSPSMPRPSKWSLYFRFPHQSPICTSPLLHKCHTLLNLLNLITWVILARSTNYEAPHCGFLQRDGTVSVVGSNIFLSTWSWKTLSLCSFLNIREQVLHPHTSTGTTSYEPT